MPGRELERLRAAMKREGADLCLIPSSDDHGSEYPAPYFEARRFLSNFTGSAGTLAVSADWAGLWTDGRYFVQAGKQLQLPIQEHGGNITITYTLNSISSLTDDAVIAHRNTGESYGANEEHPFTSAVLVNNDDNLLLNVPTSNNAAPWLDESALAFSLPTEDGASGSFTITTQELAKSAEARIRLNMVIEGTANGTKQKVLVPYTIIIKNQKEDSWTTTDGGN